MDGLDTRAIAGSELPEEAFPEVAHDFRVLVTQEAFDRITTHGAGDTSREVGGVLVGRACRDAGGPYVRVDVTIDALHAEEKGTELTFTHATWDHVHREMDRAHRGASIVGWYHTHPGFGVFLSDRDQFIHRSFFNLPFQVALVFDPVSREHGVFAWRDGEPLRVRRWWVGRREHLWDGAHPPRPAAGTTAPKERPMDEDRDRSETPPSQDLFTVALAGLVVFVVGGLAGWWIGQRGTADVVQQAQTALAEERVRGMRDALKDLNADLLGALRQSLDADARNAVIDAGLAELDLAAGGLAPSGDSAKEPLAHLDRARAKLRELRETTARSGAALRQLELALRAGALDARDVSRTVKEHGLVLGRLCAALADSAKRAGDDAQARILLSLAERCDPDNTDTYRRMAGAPPAGGLK